MKKTIYQVEVGILLQKKHPEYECYKVAFVNTNSYYNENIWFCETLEDAKESGLNYVKNGVERTYAIISKISDFDDEEHEIINGNVCYKEDGMDCSGEFTDYTLDAVVYSYCKIKGIINNFIKRQ